MVWRNAFAERTGCKGRYPSERFSSFACFQCCHPFSRWIVEISRFVYCCCCRWSWSLILVNMFGMTRIEIRVFTVHLYTLALNSVCCCKSFSPSSRYSFSDYPLFTKLVLARAALPGCTMITILLNRVCRCRGWSGSLKLLGGDSCRIGSQWIYRCVPIPQRKPAYQAFVWCVCLWNVVFGLLKYELFAQLFMTCSLSIGVKIHSAAYVAHLDHINATFAS